jgi:hypothetical protein
MLNLQKEIAKYGGVEADDWDLLGKEIESIFHGNQWIEFNLEKPIIIKNWEEIVNRMDEEIMASCKTKIWINPKLYTPSDREKPYVVGEIE